MTSCEKTRDDLSAYLEGELGGEEKKHLETHLAACEHCTMTASRLGALSTQLRKMEPVRTSEAFNVVLKSRIRRELEPKDSFIDKIVLFFRANAVPAYGLSVLSLLLLTYVSVDIYTHLNEADERNILTNELAAPPIQQIETLPVQQEDGYAQEERLNFPMDLIPARTAAHGRRSPAASRRLDADDPQTARFDNRPNNVNEQIVQPDKVTF